MALPVRLSAIAILVCLCGALLFCGAALAQDEHHVRAGQTLGRIARRYHVSVQALAAANRLHADEALVPGQVLVVPSSGTLYVRRGETLAGIAHAHSVTVAELAHANRLREGTSLREGQRIVLPGSPEDARPTSHWGRPRVPGRLSLYRPLDHRTVLVHALDRRGLVRRGALTDLARLMHPRSSRETMQPNARLVRLLARVSDHFGGRTIEIVSGYRFAGGFTQRESRHTRGEAIDFRIRGVPPTELRDFCRTFDHVGVGYYPTTHFVHLDVRRDSASWTDVSGGGEAPRYLRPGETVEQAMNDRHAAQAGDAPAGDEPAAADDGAAPAADDTQVSDE